MVDTEGAASNPTLDFVWLELTNRCNLRCTHCYTQSSPTSGRSDVLTTVDYLKLIQDIHAEGCRTIQFIGGEPTLNRDLQILISEAHRRGFSFIEVFTNLTRLSSEL